MQKRYDCQGSGQGRYRDIADVLNQLSERGFVVEQTSSANYYLLSRSGSADSNAMTRVASDDGEEVTEVARYNLQGIPVSKNEKGVQIIVYSNYTTKTVIVE